MIQTLYITIDFYISLLKATLKWPLEAYSLHGWYLSLTVHVRRVIITLQCNNDTAAWSYHKSNNKNLDTDLIN